MSGIERIAKERQRQIDSEGWTPEHDDRHEPGDLAEAAAEYCEAANVTACGLKPDEFPSEQWPFCSTWWNPSDDPIRNLEKAGALIAAEIDRLERERARNT